MRRRVCWLMSMVLLALWCLRAGEAHADRHDAEEPSPLALYPWTVAIPLGLAPQGQIGLEVERSLSLRTAVVFGAGYNVLNGFPYEGGNGRWTAAVRLRKPRARSAYGLELGGWTGSMSAGQYSHDRTPMSGAVFAMANAYYERRNRSHYTWRLFAGVGHGVYVHRCEPVGDTSASCMDLLMDSPDRMTLHLGGSLGLSF